MHINVDTVKRIRLLLSSAEMWGYEYWNIWQGYNVTMDTLYWIIGSSLLMSSIAMVGSITLLLKPSTLQRILLPLVAFAAGSLIGGAFFHMIPIYLMYK